jgi:hypothetical protein
MKLFYIFKRESSNEQKRACMNLKVRTTHAFKRYLNDFLCQIKLGKMPAAVRCTQGHDVHFVKASSSYDVLTRKSTFVSLKAAGVTARMHV